jgi:hypothetical protein
MTELTTPQAHEPHNQNPTNPIRPATIDAIGAAVTSPLIVGATRLPDGTLDLSKSALFYGNNETSPLTPLESVTKQAESAGIPVLTLRSLSLRLQTGNKPIDRDFVLEFTIRHDHLDIAPDDLLSLVRTYRKEVVRSTEKGPLYHYHQTGVDNLPSIIESGGLLSFDLQKQHGLAPKSTGTRPDVVQMTRDSYDEDGNLLRAGINQSSAGIGSRAGSMTFVFDESIMDAPDYDCCSDWPDIPQAPLDNVYAVLVNEASEIPNVQHLFAEKGMAMNVMLRSEWLKRYKNKN